MASFRFYSVVLALIFDLALSRTLEPAVALKQAQPHHKAFHQSTELSSDSDETGSDAEEGKLAFISQQSLDHHGAEALNQLPTLLRSETDEREGMEAFLNLQDQSQTTASTDADFDSQSFITDDERRKQELEAINKIDRFCRNEDGESSWLKCGRNPDDTYLTAAGTYGVTLFGLLYNDNQHKFKVYRNSDLKTSGGLMDIIWNENNLVPASPEPIPIVIKVNIQYAEETNRQMFFPEKSAMEKEVRQAREMTKFRFPSGHQITPDLYDIQVTRSGKAHPIHAVSYIQHQLSGISAWDLINQIIQEEQASMTHHLKLMLNRFNEWLEVVKATTPATGLNLKQRILARVTRKKAVRVKKQLTSTTRRRNRPMKITDVKQLMFKEAVERARKEMWLRFQDRLSMTDAIYALLYWMINSLEQEHCDSHWDNIFVINDVIRSMGALERAKKDGQAIIPSHRVHLSDTSTTSEAELADIVAGIPVYPLKPGHIKWIDPANTLPLKPILDEISKQKPGRSPADFLYAPCAYYRDLMSEDFVEVQRVGSNLALGNEETTHTDPVHLYSLAKEKLPEESTANKIYQTYIRSLKDYQSGRLSLSPLADSPEKPYLDVWQQLYTSMEELDNDVNRLGSIVTGIKRRLNNMRVYQACRKSWEKAVNSTLTFAVARSRQPWMKARQVVGTSCSVTPMKQGFQTVRGIIRDGHNKMREAEPVLFTSMRQISLGVQSIV